MSCRINLTIFLSAILLASCIDVDSAGDRVVQARIATFNVAMGLPEADALAARLLSGGDPALAGVAEILQRVRPDVVLLNEFDYQAELDAARLLQDNYLSVSWNGQAPIEYPYAYAAPVNTGVDSGMDLDLNGSTGDPADAWGFGRFPGQYGMLVLSRYPIDASGVRSFRQFLWRDMPGALRPLDAEGETWYPDELWQQLRLSSKSHWDLPLHIGGSKLHFLVSHPTPSVFDGPEDRNGTRNHDEIRIWADYIDHLAGAYLVDDQGIPGGLGKGAAFVIAGDLNADPFDGDSTEHAILQLLEHPRIDTSCTPSSAGGKEAAQLQGGQNLQHRGDPAHDTSDFNDERVGNLRIDYVLPSRGLKIAACGVFWPGDGEPGNDLVEVSDHRMAWIDLEIPAGSTE